MRDGTTFAFVTPFVWDFEPLSPLDYSRNCLYWSELRVIEVLVIRLDLEFSIVQLLFDAKLEIKNIIHCETRQVVQRLLVLVEGLDVVQDEHVRGWVRSTWMCDLQVLLLRSLAPFDATIANKTAQVDPANQGGIQRVRLQVFPEGFHVMDHLIVNHVALVRLLLILFDCLEDYV